MKEQSNSSPNNNLLRKQANERLIEAIKEVIPSDENLIVQLKDVLGLGKDAVYRRMRGDIAFTLDEFILLNQKFGFAVEKALCPDETKQVSCDLKLLTDSVPSQAFLTSLKNRSRFCTQLDKYADSRVDAVCKGIPDFLIFSFELLSKFRYFRWISQMDAETARTSLSDLTLPDEFNQLKSDYLQSWSQIKHANLVLNKDFLAPMLNEIIYFTHFNVINEREILQIKKELNRLLVMLEFITLTGTYPRSGQMIKIYISDMYIDSCYFLYSNKNYRSAKASLYSIDAMDTENPLICEAHKKWIDSFMRFSTLITCSGEICRAEFFNAQRNKINTLIREYSLA